MWWFYCVYRLKYYKRSKTLAKVMLHADLVWICNARGYWVWLVESVWAVFQNAPWAHAWLNAFTASNQEHRRISLWSRPTVVNCVRIETGCKSQAQIWELMYNSPSLSYRTMTPLMSPPNDDGGQRRSQTKFGDDVPTTAWDTVSGVTKGTRGASIPGRSILGAPNWSRYVTY